MHTKHIGLVACNVGDATNSLGGKSALAFASENFVFVGLNFWP